MPEDLLGILKLCLLALLYLFFLRVLWAVWSEIKAPSVRDAKPPKEGRRRRVRKGERASKLLVTSPNGSKQDRRSYEVSTEVTVGRAAGCQVPLADDTFVSQLHARVFVREGQMFVEDLGSTNGTYLNGQRVTAAMPLRRGDSLQIGRTVMEVH